MDDMDDMDYRDDFMEPDYNKAEALKPGVDSLADVVSRCMPSHGSATAIRFELGDHYEALSWNDCLNLVHAMAAFLRSRGTEQKVIGTLCKNRPEWDATALACFWTANILFPLDTKTNPVELAHLLDLGAPDYLLISRPHLQDFLAVRDTLGLSTVVIVADLFDVYEDHEATGARPSGGVDILSMAELVRTFSTSQATAPSRLLESKDTILGYYATSGTTSLPKIVCISHGNMVAETNEALDIINLRRNESVLNIGPYTHIATLVEFLVSKIRGFSVVYCTREPDEDGVLEGEIARLKRQGVRIRVLMGVPKFWIFLLKELLEDIKDKPWLASIYNLLIQAEQNNTLVDAGTLDTAKLMALKTVLRNKLGGYFSYGVSSSSRLDGAMVSIFGKLGITVMDVYGATECTGIIARNRLDQLRAGSCGRMMPLLEWKLEDMHSLPGLAQEAGTLMVRGPTVAPSYIVARGRFAPVADSLGWFNTGDLCWFEPQGWLYLLGRRKELMEWDDGTLIDPQHLSNLLVKSIFVQDALVTRVGPKDPALTVFVYPDLKKLEKDARYRAEIRAGIDPAVALRRRMVDAIQYARSIANIRAPMDTEHIWLLPRKLERTPTHKIKYLFELQRLGEARLLP